MEGIQEMRLDTGQGFCKDGPRQATDDQGTASGYCTWILENVRRRMEGLETRKWEAVS
jgi:hypothetical protein